MKDIRTAVIKHKKVVCILGLIFVIILECCVFPVGSITHTKWFTIGIINNHIFPFIYFSIANLCCRFSINNSCLSERL